MTKLDFLMNLTNTKNSILSKAVSFDPSYISRVRTGRRAMPRSRQFLTPLAVYFARNIKTPQQMKLAADAICPGNPLPEDKEELTRLIIDWLSIPSADSAIERKLSSLEYFIGYEGKREAVELYMMRLSGLNKFYTLLIYSDESIQWLTEDRDYLERWILLLWQQLYNGACVKVITHSIAKEKWHNIIYGRRLASFYESGQIELYDAAALPIGIHRRSMIITAGDSAMISNSIADFDEDMLCIYTREKIAINALEKEFDNYLNLCSRLYI